MKFGALLRHSADDLVRRLGFRANASTAQSFAARQLGQARSDSTGHNMHVLEHGGRDGRAQRRTAYESRCGCRRAQCAEPAQ